LGGGPFKALAKSEENGGGVNKAKWGEKEGPIWISYNQGGRKLGDKKGTRRTVNVNHGFGGVA